MSFDRDKAIQHLNSHARSKSTGRCAFYVRSAIAAGGVEVMPSTDAKNFGPKLLAGGFEQILSSPGIYEAGDVVVIQPASGHPHGHMAMYNGKIWVSDFKQQNGLYPGDGYRKEKPAFKIYRYSLK